MAGDAYETIKRFWEIQDRGDYTKTAALFSEDAILVDPLYGTFEGREAISAFMTRMNDAVASRNGSFRLVDLAGDDDVAWAQWQFTSDLGERQGVGVYRVRGGAILYYRDDMNEQR